MLAQTCGFSFRKTITVHHNQVAGTASLADFPVLIRLTDPDLRHSSMGGHIQNVRGFDVLFTSKYGNTLDFELTAYDGSTGALEAWVRIPQLSAQEDTPLYLFYGNTATAIDPSTANTWPGLFHNVWHLEEDPTGASPQFLEATSQSNHGSVQGGMANINSISAKVGKGLHFDGANDFVQLNNSLESVLGSTGALSFWVQTGQSGSNYPQTSPGITGVDDLASNQSMFYGWLDETGKLGAACGTGNSAYTMNSVAQNTWQHIALTRDQSSGLVSIYRNGQLVGQANSSPGIKTVAFSSLGRIEDNGGNDQYFEGNLDEVRVYQALPSAAWIETEFNNQNNPEGFYTVGDAVSAQSSLPSQLTGFSFRRTLTIPHTLVSGTGNLTDFPVMVSITDPSLRSASNGGHVAHNQAFDLLFTDLQGDRLSHEVESYDPSTGRLVAWVSMPSLSGSTNNSLYLFYGNSDVLSDPSSSCVWSNGFEGVWHLNGTAEDASGKQHHGAAFGAAATATTPSGSGLDFGGSGQYVDVGTLPSALGQITVQAWINRDDLQEDYLVSTATGTAINEHHWALSAKDNGFGSSVLVGYIQGTSAEQLTGNITFNANSWHLASLVYTGSDMQLFVDGNFAGSKAVSGLLSSTAQATLIGNITNGINRYVDGQMDEVRVSAVARDQHWIRTSFNNLNAPASFVGAGSEIPLGTVTSTNNGNWNQSSTWAGGQIPGVGFDVQIGHQITVSANHAVANNVLVSNAFGTNASLVVANGQQLHCSGNLSIASTGSQNLMAALFLQGDGSTVKVSGNFSVLRDSLDIHSGQVGFSLADSSTLLIDHNLDFNYQMASAAETHTEVQLGGKSTLQVSGSASFTQAGGQNLDLSFSSAANMHVLGDLNLQHQGGQDLEWHFSDGSILVVDGDLTGNLENGGGFVFHLDQSTSLGKVKIGGDVDLQKSGGKEIDFRCSNRGELEVGGDFLVDWKDAGVNGNMVQFVLSEQGRFRAGRNFTILFDETAATGGDIRVQLNDQSVFEVGRDTGALVDSVLLHVINGHATNIQLDQQASFVVHGTMNLNHAGTGPMQLLLNTQTPTGTGSAELDVKGDLQWHQTAGLATQLFLDKNSELLTGNDLNLLVTGFDQDNQHAHVWLNEEAQLKAEGNIRLEMDVSSDNSLFLDLDAQSFLQAGKSDGQFNDSAYLNLINGTDLMLSLDDNSVLMVIGALSVHMQGSGDASVLLNEYSSGPSNDAQLITWRDVRLRKSNGGQFNVLQSDGSDMIVVTDFIIQAKGFNAANKDFVLRLSDKSSIDINGNLFVELDGAYNNRLLLHCFDNSRLDVGINRFNPYRSMRLRQSGGEGCYFHVDENAGVRIFGDLQLDKSGGTIMEMALNQNAGFFADVEVHGDLDMNNLDNTGIVRVNLAGQSSKLEVFKNLDFLNVLDTGRAAISLFGHSKLSLHGSILREELPNQFGRLLSFGNDTLELSGNSTQTLSGTAPNLSDSIQYNNLLLNNSNVNVPSFQVDHDLNISNSITLKKGVMRIEPQAALILKDDVTLLEGSSGCYIYGRVRKYGNDPFIFPTGSSGQRSRIGISAPASANAGFEATYHRVNPSDSGYSVNSKEPSFDQISKLEYWDLSRIAGNDSVYVSLHWDDASLSDINSVSGLNLAHWENGKWNNHGQSSYTGQASAGQAGSITSSIAFSSFSPVTYGTDSINGSFLPVELLSFSVQPDGNRVAVNWTTASETNSDYFTVERTAGTRSNEAIGTREAAGESRNRIDYSLVDEEPIPGVSYYRLRQTDLDGTEEFSPWQVVEFIPEGPTLLRLATIPGEDRAYLLELSAPADIEVSLHDLLGYAQNLQLQVLDGVGLRYRIDIPEYLPTGIYLLQVEFENKMETRKLMLR